MKKKWRKLSLSLHNVRLREKMLIVYFFAVFFPIVITNIIFYSITTENVKNQRIQDLSRTVEQISRDFRAEIEKAVGVSLVLLMDYLLNDILDDTYEHPAEYIYAYDSYVRRILNSYIPVYHSVQSITVYVDNPTIAPFGGNIQRLTDEVRNSYWFEELTRNRLVVTRTESNRMFTRDSFGRDTFSVIRFMNYFENDNNWVKVLKIDLSSEVISRIFGNVEFPGEIYLLNEFGEIEYTTDPDIPWQLESIRYHDLDHEEMMIELVEHLSPLDYMNGWSIIAAVPEYEVIQEVRKSRQFIFYLAGIILIIPTLIIIWMVKTLNSRIIRILKHMKKVQLQNFATIDDEHSNDEIGQLTSEFNRMTLQLKSLIHDVYMADIHRKNLELERRQAQLNALQSQINPHFIFNALETLRMRSMMKKETETARIIRNLAKIMRNNLTWNKDMVPVREELELIHCFLEIQKYRFGDKLMYHVEADEQVLDSLIPKMTFLPFVENASIHGIEPLKGEGMIDITIKAEEDRLVFKIKDNGVGMDKEVKEMLRSYLKHDTDMGDRIGVQNVIYRLKLYYPDQFDFKLNSEPGEGTSVRLEIPLKS